MTAARRCNPNGRWIGTTYLPMIGLAILLWSMSAGETVFAQEVPADSRVKGQEQEKRGLWLEACRTYDEALRKDRCDKSAREGYQRCVRRFLQATRHSDPQYRQAVAKLKPAQALDFYEQVLETVFAAAADRGKANFNLLFQEGLAELRLALEDSRFRSQYLANVKPTVIADFRNRLANFSAKKTLTSEKEVREQAKAVIDGAVRDGLNMTPILASVLTLELAAGACAAVDEYSTLLTPGHLTMMQAATRGKLAGIGAEVGVEKDRLVVTRVVPKGPGAEAGLRVKDRLLRIGGVDVEHLPAEAVAEKLRGEAGSKIDIEIARDGEMPGIKRTIPLIRRAVATPSVEWEKMTLHDQTVIGYIRIFHFDALTAREVKRALADLNGQISPIKGIILDLRGNPGGLFRSALSVVELFLSEGVAVIGHSPFKDYQGPFRIESPGATQLPMVVLVDGETASSAEVLAGALKDTRSLHSPTRLLGQTTYGKGSVQRLISLPRSAFQPTGLYLTVARLFSPTNQPYTGRGITPDLPTDKEDEALLEEAREVMYRLLTPNRAPPTMLVVSAM